MKSSGIGGQAVIEGIMMKNKDRYSIAVRKPDKDIEVIVRDYKASTKKNAFFRLPVVRGVVNFIDSLVVGISTLTYSSSFYEEEEGEPTKLDKMANKLFKDKVESVVTAVTIVISLVIAVALFMVLPFFASRLLSKLISSTLWLNVIEGVIRMAIFLIYVALISQMEDIKRVFMYHGAEHKSINCIENGLELNVENVRKSSRFHKRCGTSFLLFIMLISIILFIFIRFDNRLLQLVARLLMVPVIAGISYEFLRLAGNHDNAFINALSKPGLWLQRLTTKEPDDDMIEVAIAAVEKVFDWKEYLRDNEEEIKQEASDAFEFIDMEQIESINSIEDIGDLFENEEDVEKELAAGKELSEENEKEEALSEETEKEETLPKENEKEVITEEISEIDAEKEESVPQENAMEETPEIKEFVRKDKVSHPKKSYTKKTRKGNR